MTKVDHKKQSVPCYLVGGEMVFSQAQFCKIFGINERTFRNRGLEPVMQIGRFKYYRPSDWLASIEAKVKEEKKERVYTDDAGEQYTLSEVEASKKRAEAILAQQKIKLFHEQYIPIEVLGEAVDKIVAKCIEAFDRLAPELKKQNPHLTEEIEDLRRITAETRNDLAEMKVYD